MAVRNILYAPVRKLGAINVYYFDKGSCRMQGFVAGANIAHTANNCYGAFV